ncbi:MAG: hypothetical protein IH827_05885 [Myxococcales bacterium]|nr:hypothetical protein [Myxococcales bacterium]
MTISANHRKAALLLKGALLVALLAVAAISISCADTRTTRMDAWRGHPIEELIIHWGAPNGTAKLKDGRKVYTWISVYSLGRNYRSTFTTSKDGIIESWSYHDASIPGKPK